MTSNMSVVTGKLTSQRFEAVMKQKKNSRLHISHREKTVIGGGSGEGGGRGEGRREGKWGWNVEFEKLFRLVHCPRCGMRTQVLTHNQEFRNNPR